MLSQHTHAAPYFNLGAIFLIMQIKIIFFIFNLFFLGSQLYQTTLVCACLLNRKHVCIWVHQHGGKSYSQAYTKTCAEREWIDELDSLSTCSRAPERVALSLHSISWTCVQGSPSQQHGEGASTHRLSSTCLLMWPGMGMRASGIGNAYTCRRCLEGEAAAAESALCHTYKRKL